MSERRVSVDRVRHELPEPFVVIATQNPLEYVGTFPLPESQLDRFMMSLRLGYPPAEDEKELLLMGGVQDTLADLEATVSRDEVLELQRRVERVHVADKIADYLLELAHGTRSSKQFLLGVSTRGVQNFLRAAQAMALCEGRDFVVPDDLQRLAGPVLSHRVVLKAAPPRSNLVERPWRVSSAALRCRSSRRRIGLRAAAQAAGRKPHGTAHRQTRASSNHQGRRLVHLDGCRGRRGRRQYRQQRSLSRRGGGARPAGHLGARLEAQPGASDLGFEEPPEVHCAQVFSVPFSIRNRDRLPGRRPWSSVVSAEIDPVLIPYLGAGESSRERLTFQIKRRGLHRFENVRVSSVFPFGLFEKAMRYSAGLEILVYPEIFPAGAMRHFDPLRLGEEPSRRIGWSHELRTLRLFRHGDDPRGVHWKRTARMGKLIFMEREAEEGLRLTIVLDNAIGLPADAIEAARFERLVSEAASAAVHYLAAGYEVAVTTRGGSIPYAGGRIQRQRILTALALLEALPRRAKPLWSGRRAAAELRLGRQRRGAPGVVNFYRQKRGSPRSLCSGAGLTAPLPLPFNDVVGWPSVLAFCGAAALFLLRTHRGEMRVLPYWVMNVLGLLYVPVLIGDLSMLRTGQVLPPLVHLALYAMAIKLFALRGEKDKWHVFLGRSSSSSPPWPPAFTPRRSPT